MQEYGFELALCAALEGPQRVVSRQLGAHVEGRRIIDAVVVEPGPGFADRAAITDARIPDQAIAADVGPGRARYWKDAFDHLHPDRAESVIEHAASVGFLERDRRRGRTYVRQVARYPDDWFDRLIGVENKPDLDRPGDLQRQLRTDVSLGLFDAVVLATASHVTGAHRNRLPDPVGIWRFDPETGERTVVRAPEPLSPDEPGIELLDREPGRTDVAVVDAAAKARARRRLAERAYGKGWRPDTLPACVQCAPAEYPPDPAAGVPYCRFHDRIVNPATDCGPDCPGHDPADPPDVDPAARRDARTPWTADPPGKQRTQSGLDRFG